MNRPEPLLTIAVVTALVAALLRVFVEFGIPFTEGQQGSINDLVMVVAPFVVWFVGRRFVTPTGDPKAENEFGELVSLTPVDGSRLPEKD